MQEPSVSSDDIIEIARRKLRKARIARITLQRLYRHRLAIASSITDYGMVMMVIGYLFQYKLLPYFGMTYAYQPSPFISLLILFAVAWYVYDVISQ